MAWHLVTTDYPPLDGGVATWAVGVATALRAAGEQVTVCVPSRVNAGETAMWGRSWARWGAEFAWLQVRPKAGDRVLCATWPLAVHFSGADVAFHGSDLTCPPRRSGKERVLQQARLWPVSNFLGSMLPAGWTRLPMPVDVLPPVARGDALLAIARLGPLKGVDRVLRIAARCGRPVTVVGDGPERVALQALAVQLGVRATFTGRLAREQIPWPGHHAALLMSRPNAGTDRPEQAGAEGLGLVLLEAAARGIPTVGSTTGGVPEAAMLTLPDGIDDLPELGTADDAQAFVAERHGSARVVATLLGTAR